MNFLEAGFMYLHQTPEGQTHEIEVKLINPDYSEAPIFKNFEVVRFSWRETGIIQEAGWRKRGKAEGGEYAPWKGQEKGQRAQQEKQGVLPLFFKSRVMNEQVLATPLGAVNPSFYDPCETEGVLHDMERCGLSPAYFI
jgi:hypothetical protein